VTITLPLLGLEVLKRVAVGGIDCCNHPHLPLPFAILSRAVNDHQSTAFAAGTHFLLVMFLVHWVGIIWLPKGRMFVGFPKCVLVLVSILLDAGRPPRSERGDFVA
jgi:hypothetical protein